MTQRQTGMNREQADSLAAARETRLGERVAVQGELDLGFEGAHTQIDKRFTTGDVRFAQLEAQMDKPFADIDAWSDRFDRTLDALDTRLDAMNRCLKLLCGGICLVAAMLAVLIGMLGFLIANRPPPQPIMVQVAPWPAASTSYVVTVGTATTPKVSQP